MTVPPDPAPAHPPRRPLLTGGFWVMMVFCALCLLAAAAVVGLGPRLWAVRPASPAGPSPAAAPAAPLVYAPPATLAAGPAAPPDVGALAGRVAALETNEGRTMNAAASALAVSALAEAAAGPQPFASQLTAFSRLLPSSPDVIALAPLAQQGAPTREQLAASLNDLAGQVAIAARAPGRDADVGARLLYALSRVVSVRRVDPGASGVDAALARAQRRADDGDLAGALAAMDGLPASTRATLGPWRERATRRIEIDRRIAALRAQALNDLAAAPRP
jgi:hypothetical protein